MGALLTQFMNRYGYTDFHELNADWLIKTLMEMINQVENFVSLNAIKYADPIQWDIVRQYEKNTVVIDPLTGTAYISVQPVPSGVALTRTEYWTVVFDLGSFVTRAAKNFSNRYEADTTLTATFSTTAGDWLVWGDTLYEALVNITAGDSYVVDSNIRHITIEEVVDVLAQAINAVDTKVGDLNNLNTTIKDSVVNAINEVLVDISNLDAKVGDLNDLNTTDKDSIVDAINEVNTTGGGALALIGDLNDLNTTDKDTVVDAINEVLNDSDNVDAKIGDLNDLNTTDKDSVVDAVNEVNDRITNLDLSIFQRFVSDPYFENIGVLHTYRATDEIIGQDICKIGNTLLLCNRGTVTGLNANSHLYSIDLTTGSYNSVVLPFGHGNGITYNPDENMLYICPLDPTTVGGKYVIHRVNYPSLTMTSDVYTDEYYASIAYDISTGKYVGMRRNAPTQFDVLDENLFIDHTITIDVQGVGQTLCAHDGYIYVLESAPNKISIADYDGNIWWCYVAPDHFAHYPLGEFNGLTIDTTTGELYLGDNLNYGNGFLVSSYNFFRINLFNNNVIQRELGTTYYAEEYLGIEVAPNNTIFQFGTVANPVSLLEYAIAMAHCIDNPAINFDADYTGLVPTRIVSMSGELTFTNASHTVHIPGLTLLSCNKIVMRGIDINGKCIETNACVLCNDSSLIMQNCTIDKVSAGVGTEMVLNRGDLIAPSTPFSGYTISGGVHLITLA